jgi:hypothetical protein
VAVVSRGAAEAQSADLRPRRDAKHSDVSEGERQGTKTSRDPQSSNPKPSLIKSPINHQIANTKSSLHGLKYSAAAQIDMKSSRLASVVLAFSIVLPPGTAPAQERQRISITKGLDLYARGEFEANEKALEGIRGVQGFRRFEIDLRAEGKRWIAAG